MATLFGKRYTRAELLQYVGDVSQVCGVRLKTLDNGAERGVRVADFDTGSGFRFTVLIDRAMDIGPADWSGKPLAWTSGVGAVHPGLYDPIGLGWLRSFPGGLAWHIQLYEYGHFQPDRKIRPARQQRAGRKPGWCKADRRLRL